jgi:hypothetical protein
MLVEKIIYLLFFLSSFNVISHLFNVVIEIRKEEPKEIENTKMSLFLFGLSLSYILTIIFTGFQI